MSSPGCVGGHGPCVTENDLSLDPNFRVTLPVRDVPLPFRDIIVTEEQYEQRAAV